MTTYRVPISNLSKALPQHGCPPPRLKVVSGGDSLTLVESPADDDEVLVDEATGDLVCRAYLVRELESDPEDPDSLICRVDEVTRPYRPTA